MSVVSVCWELTAAVWAAGWIAGWIRGARKVRRGFSWHWVALLPLVWVFSARVTPPSFWRWATFEQPWLADAGAVLLVASTAFTLWARWALGLLWSSEAAVREGHRLRTAGPYAVTRHPIYTGILAMILGTAAALGSGRLLAVFVASVAVLLVKIRSEERLMDETFGEQYRDYRRRVPQLVPGLRLLERR